jgi:hypothetical protein
MLKEKRVKNICNHTVDAKAVSWWLCITVEFEGIFFWGFDKIMYC